MEARSENLSDASIGTCALHFPTHINVEMFPSQISFQKLKKKCHIQ